MDNIDAHKNCYYKYADYTTPTTTNISADVTLLCSTNTIIKEPE